MALDNDGFVVDITECRGQPLLRVRGEIDLTTAPTVAEALRAVSEAGEHDVLIDLSSVTFIDSTGVAALVLARRDGVRVHIVASSPAVDRVLELSGLGNSMN